MDLYQIYLKISKSIICFTMFNYISVCLTFCMFVGYFSNQKRHTLKFSEDLSNFQPVNSHLKPFRAFWDDVCTKTTRA